MIARALDRIENQVRARFRRYRMRRALWHRAGLVLALGTTTTVAIGWALLCLLFYFALKATL